MEKGTRICKVCGVEYPYCRTNRNDGVFRYQDVACCPEHGAIYLDLIIKSRQEPDDTPAVKVEENKPKKTRKKRNNEGDK